MEEVDGSLRANFKGGWAMFVCASLSELRMVWASMIVVSWEFRMV